MKLAINTHPIDVPYVKLQPGEFFVKEGELCVALKIKIEKLSVIVTYINHYGQIEHCVRSTRIVKWE